MPNRSTAELHVERWGAGPPVVFVHGLGGSTRTWDRVRGLVEDSVSGTAIDLLGFGRSPKPADASYDVECHLDSLGRVIPSDAVIVGHSAGALLALAHAARSPARVRGVVLLSLPAYPDPETARREVSRLGMVARLTVRETRGARIMCWVMCRLRLPLMAVAPLFARGVPPDVARDALRHTYPSYSRTLHHVIVEHRAAPELVTLTTERVPVTLVHGRDDEVVPLRHVEAAVPPAVSLRTVDGDHYLPLKNPAVCAGAITSMLP